MKHQPIHLQAEAGLDTKEYPRKRWSTWLLRTVDGRTLSGPPQQHAVCGLKGPRRVRRDQLERVTCNRCRRYIERFVA